MWHMVKSPIVLDGDVVLYCNTSVVENCCTNTATWMKDFDVIVHHGVSTDSSKYTEEQRSDGFSLIIKKFEKDDINHQYSCLYDFFSYSAVLKVNKYIPTKEETHSNITMSDTFIFADIKFDIIYPSPECVLVVNGDKMETNVTVSEEIFTILFYKIKFQLVCERKNSECTDSIAINCTVGGDAMNVYKDNKSHCQDVTTFFNPIEESKSSEMQVLPITCACLVTFCIHVAVVISLIKCRKRKKKNYGGGVQTTNYVHGSSPCIITEESELSPLLSAQEHSNRYIAGANKEKQEQETRDGQSVEGCVICQSQKIKNFRKRLLFETKNDPAYIQRCETNKRINKARLQRPTKRKKKRSSVTVSKKSKVSTDADVRKASSRVPKWG